MKAKDLKSAILFGNIKCNPTRYSPLLTEKTTVSPRSSPLGPGGGGTPLQEPNGDVPLDGVAFSRLE